MQIGLKWPLTKAIISCEKAISKELQEIIERQLNVKSLEIKKGKETSVKLDTKITLELEEEGYAREISRKIQDARKKAGLVKMNKIDLVVVTDLSLKNNEKFIKERTNASKILILKDIQEKDERGYKNLVEEKIKDKKIKILFTKL